MLLGIGIDILSIPRLQGLIARRGAARVAQRICSSRELASFDQLKDNAGGDQELAAKQLRFLCARWAAKEAAFKALPPRTLSGWKDLELAYAASGRPSLVLVWEAREGGRGRAVGAGSAVNTTDVRTRADGDAQEAQGISLLPTLSHDAGVLVAAVVAQREGGR